MADFLFDVSEDGVIELAEDALEFADEQAAKEQAMKAIGELMAAALPNGDRKTLRIDVRYPDGRRFGSVRLELSSEWFSGSGDHDAS